MIATTINVGADMFSFAVVLSIIFVGKIMRGSLGGVLIAFGLILLMWSGVDSAIKLFGNQWSFLERLYHFGWVWVGIGAMLIFRAGYRDARQMMRDRDG